MTAQRPPTELDSTQFQALLDSISRDQLTWMLWYLSGYSPRGFNLAYQQVVEAPAALRDRARLAAAEASPANPYGGQDKHGHYDAPTAAAVAEDVEPPIAMWPANRYPDGVHTCAELQESEPGRRPCTCGTCRIMPPPHRLRTIERPAGGAA